MSHRQPERYEPKPVREPYVAPKFDYHTDGRFHNSYPSVPVQTPNTRQRYDSRQLNSNYYFQDKEDQTHKGYLVMMRVAPRSLAEVVNAVQGSVSSITASNGYCVGFAEPYKEHGHQHPHQHHTREDLGKVKVLRPSYSYHNDAWWDPRDDRHQARYAVVVFWFKDASSARMCFESVGRFKQPDFPDSNPLQIVAIPLTYGRNRDAAPFSPESDHLTLFWTEFPSIHEGELYDFMKHYSEPAKKLMQEYGGNPYIAVCQYEAGWGPDLNKFGSPGYARYEVEQRRVGRPIKNAWLNPRTIIAVSSFPDMEALDAFYNDPRHKDLLGALGHFAEPVMIGVTLVRIRGTSRV
ncbi:uncharacterized protein LOC128242593 isoform X2 [Mya arenaria]|uniref:uncharacterized protein LOC128242593 isoform X2 n=1 Tax=Mya arenaria TaxID=6604 RepID=UPI0022E76EA6|nr:uncharacterized protein LOC128242593 isoform X2 [Mya arenaria]